MRYVILTALLTTLASAEKHIGPVSSEDEFVVVTGRIGSGFEFERARAEMPAPLLPRPLTGGHRRNMRQGGWVFGRARMKLADSAEMERQREGRIGRRGRLRGAVEGETSAGWEAPIWRHVH